MSWRASCSQFDEEKITRTLYSLPVSRPRCSMFNDRWHNTTPSIYFYLPSSQFHCLKYILKTPVCHVSTIPPPLQSSTSVDPLPPLRTPAHGFCDRWPSWSASLPNRYCDTSRLYPEIRGFRRGYRLFLRMVHGAPSTPSVTGRSSAVGDLIAKRDFHSLSVDCQLRT